MIGKQNLDYTFHDRQFVTSSNSQSTSSLTLVDIVGATLTLKNLEEEGNYTIFFSLIVSATIANTIVSFQLLVNGIPFSIMTRDLTIKTNNNDVSDTFIGIGLNLIEGDIMQLQWKTDKGTVTLSEFNFLIDGIREERVVI